VQSLQPSIPTNKLPIQVQSLQPSIPTNKLPIQMQPLQPTIPTNKLPIQIQPLQPSIPTNKLPIQIQPLQPLVQKIQKNKSKERNRERSKEKSKERSKKRSIEQDEKFKKSLFKTRQGLNKLKPKPVSENELKIIRNNKYELIKKNWDDELKADIVNIFHYNDLKELNHALHDIDYRGLLFYISKGDYEKAKIIDREILKDENIVVSDIEDFNAKEIVKIIGLVLYGSDLYQQISKEYEHDSTFDFFESLKKDTKNHWFFTVLEKIEGEYKLT
jgi:hypothetical protein